MKRIPLLIVGLAVIALVGWRVFAHLSADRGGAGPGARRTALAVEIEDVQHGGIRDVRLFAGTVLPQYRYLVATKVAGRVIELEKRIGDSVGRGEMIARLDDAEFQQAYLEAEANLEVARSSLNEAGAELELARKELERVESLQKRDLVPSSELDNARSRHEAQQARVKLAEAQVEQRRAARESARIRLGYTQLRAAEPGLVGERLVDEGALLPANAAVVSVVGIDTVIVRTTVIERDYARIRIGQDAEIAVDSFPDRRFAGRVARLAPVLREESRAAEMEVVVPSPDHELKPGMFARVYVVVAAREIAQIVPAAAIVRRDGQVGVFVADTAANIARYVPVTVGISAPPRVEVIEPPLDAPVITLGQHLLEDGSPIVLPPPVAAAENTSPPATPSDPADPPAAGTR